MPVHRGIRLAFCAAVIAATAAGCAPSAQSSLERGNALFEKGNIDAAVLEYRNAVAKDPLMAQARVKLSEAYLRKGDVAGAIGEAVRAADLLPKDVEAQLKAGSLLLRAGRLQDARARADKALAVDAKSVEALVLRANALAGLTDLDGALTQMQQALTLDPSSLVQTTMGFIRAARGDIPEAEAAFQQAVAADAKSVPARLALGHFYWAAGRLPDAGAAFESALALEPANLLANRSLAAFLLRSGRASEAEPYFKKAVGASGSVEARLALADYYLALKRSEDALAELDRLSSEPRYWAIARSKTADIQFRGGQPAEALRTIDEVIGKHPSIFGARVVRGRVLFAQGRVADALADAQEAVRLEPASVDAQFLLGLALEARQDLDGAAKAFAEVLRLNPRVTVAQVRLAMIELRRDALPAATRLAQDAAARDPAYLPALLVLARALVEQGETERAAAIAQRLAQSAPEFPQVQHLVGRLALAKGDRAGARAAFEKALSLNGLLVEPLADLVSLDLQERKPAAARARVEQRLARTPDSGPVLTLAGRTWFATGDASKGEAFLRRAIEADSESLEAYSLLASLYYREGRADDAIAEFDRLAARGQSGDGPQTMAAVILHENGKVDEAQRRYERLIETHPQAALAANNLAWIYASRGVQLDRALQLAQTAKAAMPDEPEVNDTLGYVFIKKQLPALAVAPLTFATSRVPGNASFNYHLGLAYVALGKPEQGRKYLDDALRISDRFDGAEDARQLLRSMPPR